jgi:hypothetical protein
MLAVAVVLVMFFQEQVVQAVEVLLRIMLAQQHLAQQIPAVAVAVIVVLVAQAVQEL